MTDAVTASVRIDLPADKALRLECLRLAAQAHGMATLRDGAVPSNEVVARAQAYAAFVLTETLGSSNG